MQDIGLVLILMWS